MHPVLTTKSKTDDVAHPYSVRIRYRSACRTPSKFAIYRRFRTRVMTLAVVRFSYMDRQIQFRWSIYDDLQNLSLLYLDEGKNAAIVVHTESLASSSWLDWMCCCVARPRAAASLVRGSRPGCACRPTTASPCWCWPSTSVAGCMHPWPPISAYS